MGIKKLRNVLSGHKEVNESCNCLSIKRLMKYVNRGIKSLRTVVIWS